MHNQPVSECTYFEGLSPWLPYGTGSLREARTRAPCEHQRIPTGNLAVCR